MKTKTNMEKIILIMAIILIIICGFGFFRGFVLSMGTNQSEKTFEKLPLGQLQGIVVDSEGKIYCGLQFYSRIQVYDNKGKFLYALKINSFGGNFDLDLDNSRNLLVKTNHNQIYIFNKQGKQINGLSNTDYVFDHENWDFFRDKHGISYKIISPVWNPHVVK